MATIHPSPKLLFSRDDGDGGMDIVIKTSKGETEVWTLTPARAADLISHLSAWVVGKLKTLEPKS